MSSLRAVELPQQRTERIRALPTEAYLMPPTERTQVPLWAERVDEAIRIVARFGYSPTPTILLVSAIAITVSLHAR